MKKLALIISCILMLTACSGTSEYKSYADYLADNAVPLADMGAQPESYARFSDYELILVGESHGVAKTFDAEYMLLEYLNTSRGTTHILLELGYCEGQLLNEYLQTGDVDIIETMVSQAYGSSAYTRDSYAFYENLYAFNQTLHEGGKLHISGVDVQHALRSGAYYIHRLTASSMATDDIATHMYAIAAYDGYTNEQFAAFKSSLEHDNEAYIACYGDNVYAEMQKAAANMQQALDFYANDDFSVREKYIIENTEAALDELPGNALGIFGSAHTQLSGIDENGQPMLANHLSNTYAPTKDKVASITIDYDACKAYTSGGIVDVEAAFAVTNEAAPRMPDDISFCPLDLEGSPFAVEGEQSLQTQQYLIIIRNSEPATAFDE